MENFLFMLSLEKVDLRFPFIKIFGTFLCIDFDFRVSSFIFIILCIARVYLSIKYDLFRAHFNFGHNVTNFQLSDEHMSLSEESM